VTYYRKALNITLKEDGMFIEKFRDLQKFLAAVTLLVVELSLEALLTLEVEMSLICLVDTRRQRASMTEQPLISLFKMLLRNKASRLYGLE
jgi:hypothetical protein